MVSFVAKETSNGSGAYIDESAKYWLRSGDAANETSCSGWDGVSRPESRRRKKEEFLHGPRLLGLRGNARRDASALSDTDSGVVLAAEPLALRAVAGSGRPAFRVPRAIDEHAHAALAAGETAGRLRASLPRAFQAQWCRGQVHIIDKVADSG